MSRIRIPNNWAPRSYQLNVWRYLEHGGKRARVGQFDLTLFV
jgi:hypothetical protein